MIPLHNIPKEREAYSVDEIKGIIWLHRIGYVRFKKVRDKNWIIFNGINNVFGIDVAIYGSTILDSDLHEFDLSWIEF